MHPSALKYGQLFFEKYCSDMQDALVCDIGAQNVNGSLKDVMPAHLRYLGVDFVEGNGVDVILDDPYKLPFEDEKFDAIVCSSCFEHSEFFWLVFLELLRVLKPHGVLYLNVPSNGSFHRFPVDCWRFYPDAGGALQNWAKRSGYQPKLLESFIGAHNDTSMASGGAWNDFVAIFVKDEVHAQQYPQRITSTESEFFAGITAETTEFQNIYFVSPDHEFAAKLQEQVHSQATTVDAQASQLHAQTAHLAQTEQQLQVQTQQLHIAQTAAYESKLHVQQLSAQLDSIRNTFSWRVTKPLRCLRALLSGKAS